MRLILIAVAITALAADSAQDPAAAAQDEKAEGFQTIFNGKDLGGFTSTGENKEAFKAEDGVLHVMGGENGGWLLSDKQYGDFVLRYEYRCVDGEGNSGVTIRTPKDGNPAFDGMEIQVIRPDWETPYQRTCALYSVVAPPIQADKPFGEWNEVEVLAEGERIRTTLNGKELYDVKYSDYTEDKLTEEWQKPLTNRPMEGHIGFQCHGDKVDFTNVRIKELEKSTDEAAESPKTRREER